MTVAEEMAAALQLSDNTATNLLLKEVSGLAALTRYCRSLGDKVSRLDRNETTLNTNIPSDARDTTAPLAMSKIMAKLVFGNALTPISNNKLRRLLIGNNTGDAQI